jgi:hypothetical protein
VFFNFNSRFIDNLTAKKAIIYMLFTFFVRQINFNLEIKKNLIQLPFQNYYYLILILMRIIDKKNLTFYD